MVLTGVVDGGIGSSCVTEHHLPAIIIVRGCVNEQCITTAAICPSFPLLLLLVVLWRRLLGLVVHVHVTRAAAVLHELVDGQFGEAEALVRGEILVGVLDVQPAALPDHIQVFACVQHFLLMFGEKYWHHFIPVSESLLPVFVIEIGFNILLFASLVLFHNELFERVLEHAAEDPLLEDLEVGKRGLL